VIDSELLARIDALPETGFHGEAFRHVAAGRHPLSGAGARLHGGRWNSPESFSVLYLALERETTVREFYRLAERQSRVPEDFLPRRMYHYEVNLCALLDLRGPQARESVGLSSAALAAEDPMRCREIGECAHYCGREGILAPSATGRGEVLAIFFERLRPDSEVRDVDSTEWVAVPAHPPVEPT
jgi:RES domain-containing protein